MMINEDREEDVMVSYIARSGQLTISDLTENTPTHDVKFSDPPVREIDLNFDTSTDCYMLKSIVVNSDIMYVRYRITKNLEHGRTVK